MLGSHLVRNYRKNGKKKIRKASGNSQCFLDTEVVAEYAAVYAEYAAVLVNMVNHMVYIVGVTLC